MEKKNEKPKIIKAMEERTKLKYYDLYKSMKIKEVDEIIFDDNINCECGKKDIKFVSLIEVNNNSYNIGCICIGHIKTFLNNELEIMVDKGKKEKIKICLEEVTNVLNIFNQAIKNHKNRIKKFKKLLDEQENIYKNIIDDLENNYIKEVECILLKSEWKMNNDTFKKGKYKDKKYYEINDFSYLRWIIEQEKEKGKEIYKSFDESLIKNIKIYRQRYYNKFIKI